MIISEQARIAEIKSVPSKKKKTFRNLEMPRSGTEYVVGPEMSLLE